MYSHEQAAAAARRRAFGEELGRGAEGADWSASVGQERMFSSPGIAVGSALWCVLRAAGAVTVSRGSAGRREAADLGWNAVQPADTATNVCSEFWHPDPTRTDRTRRRQRISEIFGLCSFRICK